MKKLMIVTLFFGLSSMAYAQSPSAGGFSYAQSQQAFQSAVAPTTAQLTGAWKMVGLAVPGADPDKYDGNGLTNADWSLYDALSIQLTTNVLTGAQQLSVGMTGMGSTDYSQGPFTPNINSSGLEFETYGYVGHRLDTSITFPRVCKIVTATGTLICHEDDTNDSTVDYGDEYDVYVHEG